jgi:hypothetical protein
LFALVLAAFASSSCGSGGSQHRTTILTTASSAPPPPPESNEVRLEPATLFPGAPDPTEIAPGSDLGIMAHRALDAAQTDLIQCYLGILPEAPDATGRLEVQFDLGTDGHVSRVQVDQVATDGFERIVPCIRHVVGELHVQDVNPHGRYVSRVYTFHSTTIDRDVHDVFTVRPPPRPARPARPSRHGRAAQAPASPAPTASSSPPPPSTRTGMLDPAEIVQTLGANAAPFQACYGPVLQRYHRAVGTATATFVITRRGTVDSPAFTNTAPAIGGVVSCATGALRSVRFRASGIETHVRQAIAFQP